ncbi:MAG: META domain-containing protein [Flavobacteriaceae bacterium]|jgi:heat shock protein HslJ|nr:META domain-containing protein [Flavobacteriaceae bacterium]
MKKKLLSFNLFFLGSLMLLILSSCSSSKEVSKKEKKAPTTTEEPKRVVKKRDQKQQIDIILGYLGNESIAKWKLKASDESSDDLHVIRFDEPWKQIYGVTGCNKFTAYYTKDDDNLLSISISRVSATELQCEKGGNESSFLGTLEGANEVREDGSTLSLLNNGQEVLVFERY